MTATPGVLVEKMSDILGVPAPTVTLIDRNLSEAGLRSKGGRGRSAARMTAKDAARLLIAILASPSVGNAAQACRSYGELPIAHDKHFAEHCALFARNGLKCISKLPIGCCFSQAVEALITEAAEGGGLKDNDRTTPLDDRIDFRITVQTGSGWASFIITEGKQLTRSWLAFADIYGKNKKKLPDGDMSQDRHISYKTIRMLGTLVAEGAE
jgi:hypothetical protein